MLENNETTSKKVEEEMTVIEQKITEADEKWSQTEREVHSFQAEVNTKVTNIEEKQKETREEWEKVQNRFTEKCDGIEAAVTSINGQVHQNQADIETCLSRPTNLTNCSTTENREWVNFRLYQRKPMEFIARIEEYLSLIHI